MKRFAAYLYARRGTLLAWALAAAVFGALGALYALPPEPFAYAAVLSGAAVAAMLAVGWPAWAARCRALEQVRHDPPGRDLTLPEPEGGDAGLEAAYQGALRGLTDALADQAAAARARQEKGRSPSMKKQPTS